MGAPPPPPGVPELLLQGLFALLLRLSGPPHDGTLCSSLDVPRKVHPWPLNLSPDTVRFIDQVERDSVLVTVIDCAAGMGEGIQLTAREPQNDTLGLSAHLTPFPL